MLPLLFPLFTIRSKNTLPAHKVILGALSEPSPLLSRDVERGRGIMALDLRCSSCDSDNIQRLSVLRGQKTVGGTIGKGQTSLTGSLKEPSKPWASTVGFIVGLCTLPIFSGLAGGPRSSLPVLAFLLVWRGIRYWMSQAYEIKYQSWKDNLDENYICLRCGNIFSPPSESGDRWSTLSIERDIKFSNKRLGYAAMFGVAIVGLAAYAVYESQSKPGQMPKPSEQSEPSKATMVPPGNFRGLKWGSSPNASLKKYSGPTFDGITGYVQVTGKTPSPLFETPVVEELYSFANGKFYSGDAFFDGRDNFAKVKAALYQAYGQPSFVNEKLGIWKWKWQGTKIEVHLSYQAKFSRTWVTFQNYAI